MNYVLNRQPLGVEDLTLGIATVTQTRGGTPVVITQLNASNIPYDATDDIKTAVDSKVATTDIGVTVEAYDATILKDADIGVSVQAYNTNTTIAGNTFNGISQLVQTDGTGKYPALDGSLITNLASGFADPMTTRGDIIVRDASNITSRLGVGTAGQVLGSNGTDIVWGAGSSQVAADVPVTPMGNLISTDVQAALVELQGDIDARYTKTETDILLQTEIGVPIASAATTSIGSVGAGDVLHIVGTNTIDSFGVSTTGTIRTLIFDSALTITHNGTSMVLPNNADMLIVAGSSIEVVCENGTLGYWRCTKVMHNDVSMTELSYISTLTSDAQTQLNSKQATLTIDTAPTDGSTNPVQSNGVFDALALKAATTDVLAKTGGIMTGAITALRETKVAMGANDINLATGNLFTKTISGATTLTVSNWLATGNANSFILELTNGGSAVITWFSGIKWASGTAPTLTAAGVDILGFYSHDGGTTVRGIVLAKDSK